MRIRVAMAVAVAAATALSGPTLAAPTVTVPSVAGHQSLVYWGGRAWALDPGVSPAESGSRPTDSTSAVWVDGGGALHLKAVSTSSGDTGPSLTALSQTGYGTYTWTVDRASITKLDPYLVLGLFLYSSAPTDSPSTRKREIDVENSRFGAASSPNGQFAVQPYWVPGHRIRFNVTKGPGTVTERFTWLAGRVTFEAFSGPTDTRRGLIEKFSYSGGDVPPVTAGTLLRMNLWTYWHATQPGYGHEVVLRSFTYTPAPGQPIVRR